MEININVIYLLVLFISFIDIATSNQNQNDGIVVTSSSESCSFDTVHEDTNSINSPNYPYNYPANFSCLWKISAPTGKRVKVLINDLKFETEKCKTWHYLRVLDDPSRSPKQYYYLREIDSPMHIVSSNESLHLYQNSWNYPPKGCENHMTDRGFHLEYSVYESEVCSVLVNDIKGKCDGENVCNCKGDYCLGGGGCSYGDVFIRSKPVGSTSWDITDADVICRQMGFDSAIRSTNDRRFATSKDRDKYVMTNIRCKGNETTIEDCDYRKFDSDSRNKAAGVECYVKDTKVCNEDGECITWYPDMFCNGKNDLEHGSDEVGCNGQVIATIQQNLGSRCDNTIDRKQQMIRSPGFPNVYGNNLHCKWLLKAPQGKKIVLKFFEFETEDCHDGISIYDGDTIKWWEPEELRQELCGSTIPSNVETTGDTVLIAWSSDESISLKGFRLKYDII